MNEIGSGRKFEAFKDLPSWAQSSIKRFRLHDAKTWVHESVPALGGRSVLEVLAAGEEGEMELREYLARVAGKFFDG